jgi:hypothetical protein
MNHRLIPAVMTLLTLAACGPGVDDQGASTIDIPVHHDGLTVRSAVAAGASELAVGAPVKDFVAERAGAVVIGQGFPGADGAVVRVVTGILGCGFLETGRGEGRLASGTFTVDVRPVEKAYGYGEELYVFVDTDSDGACDESKGETVYATHVSSMTGTLTLEAASLTQQQGWMCSIVNRPQP